MESAQIWLDASACVHRESWDLGQNQNVVVPSRLEGFPPPRPLHGGGYFTAVVVAVHTETERSVFVFGFFEAANKRHNIMIIYNPEVQQ